jgi:CO/xanthine dehydrogenase Mo-binding subunit
MTSMLDKVSTAHPLTRRNFLVTMTSMGLAFGFTRFAEAAMDPAVPSGMPATPSGQLFDPTLWFAIDGEGVVTINIHKAEMGQHIGTAMARILADELEADWDMVRIVHVDSDPKWGFMMTGGSYSVWLAFPVFSRAGAAGRTALIEAGARLLGAPIEDCVAREGRVISGDRMISYGEIVRRSGTERTFSNDELGTFPTKPASERRLIGRPVKALDVARKVDGTARYGIDAVVPDMVYARPKLPPTRNGSKVVSIDDSAAKKVKGYLRTITLDDPSETISGWVLVIADTYYAAIRATELIEVKWTPGPGWNVSEKDLLDHGAALIAKEDAGVDLDVGSDSGAKSHERAPASALEQTYTTATVLHFQLEPVNALAFEKDGVMEVHTGNQWPDLIVPVLAKALGRSEASVVVRSYFLGGGFGRRLNGDYAIPAALAAKALGRPVKMVLTREDDARFDSVRSPSIQQLRMEFDAAGRIQSMAHHACAGWPTQVVANAFLAKGLKDGRYDPYAIAGADHWYDVGHQRVRAISNDLANETFRPGWLRSVGAGWTNWALESFMDEAAHHIKADPVEFRLKLLTAKGHNAGTAPNSVGGALRQAEVVRRAAERAGWGAAVPKDSGLGLATSFGQERSMPTWVACVARVQVERSTGIIRVEKLTIVADCGTVVDPDSALAQMQGAALWGLSMALHEGTEFVDGQVRDLNLDTYSPLRIYDVPELDISFVESTEAPVGLGEPATTVVAPAIGNAIYNAIGARLRHIPITPAAIVEALRPA